jgi:group II intron reverse transcriptase/maturase
MQPISSLKESTVNARVVHTPGPYCAQNFSSALTETKLTDYVVNNVTTENLLDRVLARENMFKALAQVERNKGAAGIDGVNTNEIRRYLKINWPQIREQIINGNFKPSCVKRVDIPKPNGGTRQLGIPTVVDRIIQQAILQVLSPIFDPLFSESSFGFRPGRSAHQAVLKTLQYQRDGAKFVVDIDLEKFFDRVNHDILMYKLSLQIKDKRLLKLIRSYLNSGIMVDGIVEARTEGTPQGSPLSPLLSNIMLDEFDKELEKRGHQFARYADDCNIYVKTKRAGIRVFTSIKRFLETRLKLRINENKSKVSIAWRRKFLGYSTTFRKIPTLRLADETKLRFRNRIREITRGHRQIPLEVRILSLNKYIQGWMNYFRYVSTHKVLQEYDMWIRRRLRMCLLKIWRKPKTRFREFRKLGAKREDCFTLLRGKQYWRMSNIAIVNMIINNKYFKEKGLMSLEEVWRKSQKSLPTAVYGSVRTVV